MAMDQSRVDRQVRISRWWRCWGGYDGVLANISPVRENQAREDAATTIRIAHAKGTRRPVDPREASPRLHEHPDFVIDVLGVASEFVIGQGRTRDPMIKE